jgi:hypothetical protein
LSISDPRLHAVPSIFNRKSPVETAENIGQEYSSAFQRCWAIFMNISKHWIGLPSVCDRPAILSSLTISAKPVGVGVASQPWILGDERSSLLTRIAMTESVLLCVPMRS